MEKNNKLISLFTIGIVMMIMLGASYVPAHAESLGQRNLSMGKIGGDVRLLQIDLKQKGYKIDSVDGIYGLKTQRAVIELQKSNGLKPNGVFDKKTNDALKGRVVRGRELDRRLTSNKVSRSFSRKDVMLLARAVHGEARGEPFKGQVAVAAVIVNRTHSGKFPHTIEGVLFQQGAFDAVDDGQIWLNPDGKAIKAAELALSGYDPTGDCLYYWNPAKTTNKWIWSRPVVTKIGQHLFAR